MGASSCAIVMKSAVPPTPRVTHPSRWRGDRLSQVCVQRSASKARSTELHTFTDNKVFTPRRRESRLNFVFRCYAQLVTGTRTERINRFSTGWEDLIDKVRLAVRAITNAALPTSYRSAQPSAVATRLSPVRTI